MTERIPAERLRELLARPQSRRKGHLRLSDSQAKALGLSVPEKPAKAPYRRAADAFDPQARLTEALRKVMGEDAVQSEVFGIIPGRRYRADIVIPSRRLVIEFDGFQYHRSKAAFQSDRKRQNLFALQGWFILRFFHKQVRDDLESVVAQILGFSPPSGVLDEKNPAAPKC